MQKNGIWSKDGGTGWLNSMSQMEVSGSGTIGELSANIRCPLKFVMFPPGGHTGMGPLRALEGHSGSGRDEWSSSFSGQFCVFGSYVEPSSSSLIMFLVMFGSSMAEQAEDRTRSPSTLDNIWRRTRRLMNADLWDYILKPFNFLLMSY